MKKKSTYKRMKPGEIVHTKNSSLPFVKNILSETSQSVNDLLATRSSTHGSFSENGFIAQELKRVFRSSGGWPSLSCGQKESLDLIATKISRILSGRANFADHWDDIMGYADLGKKHKS